MFNNNATATSVYVNEQLDNIHWLLSLGEDSSNKRVLDIIKHLRDTVGSGWWDNSFLRAEAHASK